MRVEVGLKGRRTKKIESMIRQTRKRKRCKAYLSSSDEDQGEEVDVVECEAEGMAEGVGEEMDEVVVKEQVLLEQDDVQDPGFLVEEPGNSASNYLVSRNESEDHEVLPYRPNYSVGDDTENGTSTPEITLVFDDD